MAVASGRARRIGFMRPRGGASMRGLVPDLTAHTALSSGRSLPSWTMGYHARLHNRSDSPALAVSPRASRTTLWFSAQLTGIVLTDTVRFTQRDNISERDANHT
jgi:hypothetical protein